MISDGILVLNKPRSWTSHDCVAICRRVLRLKGVKKIGHGGTLDPMAEGVLPIFIGQATRIMEYLELDHKQYTCRMQLGITTDTQDIWGTELTRRSYQRITEQQILRELDGFRGIIEQMPPVYSAVRIDGRHLYDYARKGRAKQEKQSAQAAAEGESAATAENAPLIDDEILQRIKPRRVFISALDVQDINTEEGTVCFSVECSKGTYIRTICSELGERLGCGGAMTALTRTAIGSIDLSRSVSPEEVKAMDRAEGTDDRSIVGQESESDRPAGSAALQVRQLEDLLIPTDAPLTHFGEVTMPEDRAHYFRQGNSIRLHQVSFRRAPEIPADPLTGEIPRNARGRRYDRIYRVYQQENGMFLGTGYEDRGQRVLKADKVFTALNEPKQNK